MDRVAFVIPLHPPYFHWMHRVLDQLPPNSSRVYIVFSTPADRDAFGPHPAVTPVVIPQGLVYHEHSPDGIVDYKKFYALSQLMDAPHDYFIVCDAEISLIPSNFTPENVLSKIESIFANKQIYYGIGTGGGNTRAACDAFSGSDFEKLKDMTIDFKAQFWWSDLPVFRRDTLKHFFEVLPIPDKIYSRPDYNIYQCYLALYHGFKFVCFTPLIGTQSSLEGFATRDPINIYHLCDIGYGHSWVVSTQYSLNREILDGLGTFIVYHLDRWTTPDFIL